VMMMEGRGREVINRPPAIFDARPDLDHRMDESALITLPTVQ